MRGAGPGSREADAVPVDFDTAHAQLLADPKIQFELPAADPTPPRQREASGWLDWLLGGGIFDSGLVAQALFWGAVVLAAAGLLYLIVTRIVGWQRSPRSPMEAAVESWHMEEEPARQLLDEADALAAADRFAEAVHLLLHRSIDEIDRRRPATVRKALTSRDIAALPAIPSGPAAAFRAIASAVERSLFARRPIGEQEWRECRQAYRSFAFAREWQR